VINNFLDKGSDGDVQLPRGTGEAHGNLIV